MASQGGRQRNRACAFLYEVFIVVDLNKGEVALYKSLGSKPMCMEWCAACSGYSSQRVLVEWRECSIVPPPRSGLCVDCLEGGCVMRRLVIGALISLGILAYGCESGSNAEGQRGPDADDRSVEARVRVKSLKTAVHEHELFSTGHYASPYQTVLLELEGPSDETVWDTAESGVDHVDYLFEEDSLYRMCVHRDSLSAHRFRLLDLASGALLGETSSGQPCIESRVSSGVYRLEVTHQAQLDSGRIAARSHIFLEPVVFEDKGTPKADWFSECSQIQPEIAVPNGVGCTATGAIDGNCTLCELAGMQVSGLDFRNVKFDYANFTDPPSVTRPWAGSAQSTFSNCTFTDCSFRGAKLVGVDFSGATFTGTDFQGADMSSASIANVTFDPTSSFNATEMGSVLFYRVHASGVDWTGITTNQGPLHLLPSSMEGPTAAPADTACADHQNDFTGAKVSARTMPLYALAQRDVAGTECTIHTGVIAVFSGDLTGFDFVGNLSTDSYSGGNRSLAKFTLQLEAGVNLAKTNWAYSGANFQGLILPEANFTGANLSGLDFSGGDVSKVTIDQLTKFRDSNLADAAVDFSDLNLAGVDWRNVNLTNANLARSNLAGADLANAVLVGVTAYGARFDNAVLDNVNMAGSQTNNFENCTFRNASLKNADLSGAQMVGVQLHGNNTSLTSATLVSTNFTRANLSSADLRQTNGRGAIFLDANLTGANLQEADFQPTAQNNASTFSNAYLCGAKLAGTILYGADLSGVFAPLQAKVVNDAEGNIFYCPATVITDPKYNDQTICPDSTKAAPACTTTQWTLPQEPPPPCCISDGMNWCPSQLAVGETCSKACDCQSENCFEGKCK